jgi:hypothetical protein
MAFGGSKPMHVVGKLGVEIGNYSLKSLSEVTIFRLLWHLGSFCGLFQQALFIVSLTFF